MVPWLLGDGWWKTTSDLLDLDEQGLGVGSRANDGFDSSRVGQAKIDEQDTATKTNPEHGLLDLTDIGALARLMQGPGQMHLHGVLGAASCRRISL